MSDSKPILIVEDDGAIRETLRDLLEFEGFQVILARDGSEGIAKLKSMAHPCLILLDLMMPVMDGQEFLLTLRKEDADVVMTIPVMLMSAAREAETSDAAKMVSGFLKKPLDLDDLVRAVTNHCASKAA